MSKSLYYTIIVSLGGFIFGFDASVISGAISLITIEFELSNWQQGFLVASPTLGAIVATLTAGAICDAIGRRKVLIVIACLYAFSAVLSASAPNYLVLVIARIIGGLAFCSLMIAPLYIAEISRPELRGRMVSVNQLNIVVGFSAAYFANYAVLQISQSSADWVTYLHLDSASWRWMLGLETIPALAYILLLIRVPETPRWLILNKQHKTAQNVLASLYPKDQAKDEYGSISKSVMHSLPPLKLRLNKLFSMSMIYCLGIGLILGISQQITGINAVFFYAPSIFEQSGIGTNAAFAQAILIGITNIVFTLVAIAFIDRFGRKPLLIVGLTGIILSMGLCALGFAQATYSLSNDSLVQIGKLLDVSAISNLENVLFNSDVEFKKALIDRLGETLFNTHQAAILASASTMNSTLILLGILGFVASFAVSLGPVMWVMFSEIFPNELRGLAISFVGVVNSIASFCVQLVFPWEVSVLGNAMTFCIYACLGSIFLVLVIKFVPETKNKSLEELESILVNRRR